MKTTICPYELRSNLETFIGTESFYKIPLLKTQFTDGVKYLADAAECFWLVTDASVVANSLMNRSHFITIDFKKLADDERERIGFSALIEYSDGNGNILDTHKYHATDFPLEKIRLFYMNGTLMLSSEY
ncbi:MAG: DUF6876 family protein [Pricia sp.]